MDQLLRQILTELRGAWRFRWLAMAVIWLVGLGGAMVVLMLPDKFEALAEVYVDTDDPLLATQRAGGGADRSAQARVDYVRRMLLSTPNLQQVARQTDLDLRAATPQEFQALVAKLQRDIQVRAAGWSGFEANLYRITYQDADRRIAERVVQVLLNSFQEQSVDGSTRDDMQALAFLDAQIAEYRRRLEQAESNIADFRRRNAGLTPGSDGGFFARLATLQEELRETQANLRIAQETRAALAAQFSSSGSGSGGSDSGATSLAELEAQVLNAEKRLDELRLVYTDEHPSVISAEETVSALQGRLERRREELGPLLGSGAAGAVVENVRIALTQAEIQVTELRGRERDLRERIAELQAKVDIAPQLEAEFTGLVRDNSVLRSQYESLLQRRELLSFDIDRKKQGRQLEFRIIEPPLAPDVPVAPDRFRLMLMVLAAALAAGGGLAFLLHQARPVFSSANQLYEGLGVPVLGSVSMAWTRRAMWRHRRTEVVFALGLVLLVGVFGVVLVALPQMTVMVQDLLG
jgi:polysaccharide chain length determinant protein (PEP-CTERM system associated)